MKRTLFVVGAGASCDFGFPLGTQLADRIRDTLDSDFGNHGQQDGPIAQALMRSGGLSRADSIAAIELRDALINSPSIDHALYTRRNQDLVVRVGKICIADQILKAERESHLPDGLTTNRDVIFDGLLAYRYSWLARLFRYLALDRTPQEYNDIFDQVEFITFNYDRCIEQYLFYALQAVGNQDRGVAAEILARKNIHHVYGSLGQPQFLGGQAHTGFGTREEWVANAASSIKTFTEGAEEGTLLAIQRLVQDAARVVFLGFGFDQLNVSALYPTGQIEGQEICGTIRISNRRRREFAEHMFNQGEIGLPKLVDRNCPDFIDEFGEDLFL